MGINNRAQVSMGDLFLAASILIILTGAIALIYDSYTDRLESRQEFKRLQLSAIRSTELLVKSPGMPEDWEEDITGTVNSTSNMTLSHIGLSNPVSHRNISPEKLEAFRNISYDAVRDIMGSGHDFIIRVMDIQGNLLLEKGGNNTDPEGNRTIVSVERRALLEGDEVVIRFNVFS
ncbi:MAG: hypothetical protein R6U32_02815 [Candidatus Woesearchaeota archaeon]